MTTSLLPPKDKKPEPKQFVPLQFEQVARICHEANRALCELHDDFSQEPWELTPKEIQESAILGVEIHFKNPSLTPEQSHETWLAHKRANGWKYGPTKDFQKKEHPCFRPYKELSHDQQAKDYLFKAICNSLRPFMEQSPRRA